MKRLRKPARMWIVMLKIKDGRHPLTGTFSHLKKESINLWEKMMARSWKIDGGSYECVPVWLSMQDPTTAQPERDSRGVNGGDDAN